MSHANSEATTPDRSTVDPHEVAQFDKLSESWWDETGPMKPLHKLNPTRIAYIRSQICQHFDCDQDSLTPFKGLKILDIGCGGGIASEPLARMGAQVTGIDAAENNIQIAQDHADKQGLGITYQAITAEELAKQSVTYDIVLALEIIEHVADPALFVETCAKLTKKGGLAVFSTLNRTPKSFALGIVAAEYILRWVPRGTHQWKKFVKPSELSRYMQDFKLTPKNISGLIYNPLSDEFKISDSDMDVNYFLCAEKE